MTYIKNTDHRPLFQLTVSEFMELQKSVVPEVINHPQTVETPRQKINGIRGLAKFLDVSTPTAQRLKNENRFPHYASGNKYFFFSDEVNNGLKVKIGGAK
jgi:hypothetical protein